MGKLPRLLLHVFQTIIAAFFDYVEIHSIDDVVRIHNLDDY